MNFFQKFDVARWEQVCPREWKTVQQSEVCGPWLVDPGQLSWKEYGSRVVNTLFAAGNHTDKKTVWLLLIMPGVPIGKRMEKIAKQSTGDFFLEHMMTILPLQLGLYSPDYGVQELHSRMKALRNNDGDHILPFSHHECIDVDGRVWVVMQVYPRKNQFVFRKVDVHHHAQTKKNFPNYHLLHPHDIYNDETVFRPKVEFTDDSNPQDLDPFQLLPTEGASEGTEYKQMPVLLQKGDISQKLVDFFWPLFRGCRQFEFWLGVSDDRVPLGFLVHGKNVDIREEVETEYFGGKARYLFPGMAAKGSIQCIVRRLSPNSQVLKWRETHLITKSETGTNIVLKASQWEAKVIENFHNKKSTAYRWVSENNSSEMLYMLTEDESGVEVQGELCPIYAVQFVVDSRVNKKIYSTSSFKTYRDFKGNPDGDVYKQLMLDGTVLSFGSPHAWTLCRKDQHLEVRELLENDHVTKLVLGVSQSLLLRMEEISGTGPLQMETSFQFISLYAERLCVIVLILDKYEDIETFNPEWFKNLPSYWFLVVISDHGDWAFQFAARSHGKGIKVCDTMLTYQFSSLLDEILMTNEPPFEELLVPLQSELLAPVPPQLFLATKQWLELGDEVLFDVIAAGLLIETRQRTLYKNRIVEAIKDVLPSQVTTLYLWKQFRCSGATSLLRAALFDVRSTLPTCVCIWSGSQSVKKLLDTVERFCSKSKILIAFDDDIKQPTVRQFCHGLQSFDTKGIVIVEVQYSGRSPISNLLPISPMLSLPEFHKLIETCEKVYSDEASKKCLARLQSKCNHSERNLHNVVVTAAMKITKPLKEWLSSLLKECHLSVVYAAFMTVFTDCSLELVVTEKSVSPLHISEKQLQDYCSPGHILIKCPMASSPDPRRPHVKIWNYAFAVEILLQYFTQFQCEQWDIFAKLINDVKDHIGHLSAVEILRNVLIRREKGQNLSLFLQRHSNSEEGTCMSLHYDILVHSDHVSLEEIFRTLYH